MMPKLSARWPLPLLIAVALLAVCTLQTAPVLAQPMLGGGDEAPAPVWTARLDPPVVAAGGTVTLELVEHIPDGFHGYVIGTADSGGMESTVDDHLLPGLTPVGDWQQPDTVLHHEQPVLFGTSVFRRQLKVAADAAPGVHRMELAVTGLICDEEQCYPPKTVKLPLVLTIRPAATTGPSVTWEPGGEVTARWTVGFEKATVQPGQVVNLRARVEVAEGHHTYLPARGEDDPMGTILQVDWAAVPGLSAGGEITFDGHTHDMFGEQVVGPDGTFVIPVKVAADAAAGARSVKLTLQFTECDELQCWPPQKTTLELSVVVGGESAGHPPATEPIRPATWEPGGNLTAKWTIGFEPTAVTRGQRATIRAHVKLAEGRHTYLPATGPDDASGTLFEVEWAGVKGVSADGEVTFQGETHELMGSQVVGPDGTFQIPVQIAKTAEPGRHTLTLKLTYSECTDQSCFPPEATTVEISFDVTDSPPVDPAPAVSGTTTGAASGSGKGNGGKGGAAEGMTLWYALGLAFVGGLILNLMPCVLPVLGIKILGFVESAHSTHVSPVVHSLMFTLGVLSSFWVLAIVMIILAAAGQAAGWGFQLANPVFLFVMTAVMFAFGLNLFGLFEVGTSLQGLAGGKKKSGLSGSFFTGIMATLVATPCTAPFMAPALGYTITQPWYITLMIFTLLGIGMSSPYIILASSPKLLNKIPKPGPWMVALKQFMGFLLMGTCVWMLWVYTGLVGRHAATWGMAGLVIVGLGLWVYGRWFTPLQMPRTKRVALVLTLLFLVGGMWLGLSNSALSDEPGPGNGNGKANHREGELPWKPHSPERLAELQQKGVPVFIDYTADW